MNEKIKKCLDLFNYPVMYGRVMEDDIKNKKWNYFVFSKRTLSRPNATSLKIKYNIVFVHESYIPEGFEMEIIKMIEENTKLKLDGEALFNYAQKGNTDDIVESVMIPFSYSVMICG